MATIASTGALTDLFVMGSKLKSNIKEAVTSATISLTTEEVSQIEITLIDPDYKILKTGLFNPKTPVRFRSQNFIVASVETGEVAKNEQVTIKCRPAIVQKLKERRGAKSMGNASPSDFVIAECKAVGAKYVVQPSAKQDQVSRDVPEQGQTYELENTPSTWTTFQRLAREVGFILFEVNSTIYFGKPSWIVSRTKNSPMEVTWNTGYSYYQAETPPVCSKSVDAKEVTVSVTLPLQRTKDAATGKAFKLVGVPTFNGTYMTKSIEYSLMGNVERMTVTAGTPIDPVAQPPAKTNSNDYTYESIAQDVTTGGSYVGVWPLPSKYGVGTPYGKKGSWSAGYHTGADLPAPKGTPAYAVYDGKITIGGWGDAYGKHVILTVGKKKYGYCHLSKISVYSGQSVKAGTKIGEVGATGRAFGNHLHFELRYSPFKYANEDADPIPTLKKKVSGTSGTATSSNSKLTIDGKPWDGSLKGLLTAVGFKGKALEIAMGVVWAESNNNAQAVGDTSLVNSTWGPSIGLFQIRSLKNPSSATGLDKYRIENSLYDPVYNAALAYQMSKKGTYWQPWSAYNNGSYKKFIGKNGTVKGLGVSSSSGSGSSGGAKLDNGATKSANSLVIRALSQAGKRYVFGATRYPTTNDPSAFDCSSLVNWCFSRMGIKIPDLVLPKIDWCRKNGGVKLSPSEGYKVRGALMMRTNTTPRHIGISLGDGRTIEAVSSKLGVRKMDTRYNWTEAWAAPKIKYGSDLSTVIAQRSKGRGIQIGNF